MMILSVFYLPYDFNFYLPTYRNITSAVWICKYSVNEGIDRTSTRMSANQIYVFFSTETTIPYNKITNKESKINFIPIEVKF